MSHVKRLGSFNRVQAVFAYLNTNEGQAALSATYGKLSSLSTFLTQALSVNNQISYDAKQALLEFSKAHFEYMVFNTENWITSKLAEEAAFWGSGLAAASFPQSTVQTNLNQVQALQALGGWLKIDTSWLV
jgi:hypothetical protein